MAKVTVKLFGVLRMDTHLAKEALDIEKVDDLFVSLNERVDAVYAENKKSNPNLQHPEPLAFKHTVMFVNGEPCKNKNHALADGDEIWLLSPASGG
ncbi:MAG: MoaD/ThiS family protein [Clostridia bacterium]|nr:MoaD/ThiS family protein [Clostridia bacterium]